MSWFRHGALRQKVMDFFRNNPDEELTVQDAAQKFGVTEKTARNVMAVLQAEGEIQRQSVYRPVKDLL